MGKPKPGFEERFVEIYRMITENRVPKPSIVDRIKGRKYPTKEELLHEWFDIQIPSYETIKAPKVGRDTEADEWLRKKYQVLEEKPPLDQFIQEHQGYYVIELAKEVDGVPVYISPGQDENVFRGKFLEDCVVIIGEDLANEAWESKLADEALNYGYRLRDAADKIARESGIEYIKEQRFPPDCDEDAIESKLHIVYSLAKWLIFYGKNGHGYEADF